MTRVSDTPAFAAAVAEGGALPFLALALLKGSEVQALLADTSSRLGGKPWGVGLLGFAPAEMRQEQVAAIVKARPPWALIAGGRPDQARELEAAGIATFLHAPSPALLAQYLRDGARRFVLEGRECGGHVGPRSSFVLWEQAIGVIEAAVDGGIPAAEFQILCAGGVHDARSAAMVAAQMAPLAARGVKLGVLAGTAYLFTKEAVRTGAILPGYQAAAVVCERTVLLETGPGHEVRVSPSPFATAFEAERRRLVAGGGTPEAVREALESLNAGRLRLAAKGVERRAGAGTALVSVGDEDQYARGTYMLGQAAALRDRVTTIPQLHREIAEGSARWLEARSQEVVAAEPRQEPSDIAIVGMSAIVPGAGDVKTFWENTLKGVDAITEVPADRWDWRTYYDPDPKAPDKITSKWGGFVPDVPFDPLRYGMPPNSLPSIEPMQLLMLEAVRSALDDAGYRDRPFPRERTAVVLGAGGGAAQLAMGYAFRSYLPMLGADAETAENARALLPEWTEDSFPGILLNVAAGRVANRFDLGGANYTVDAACGSSLAAASLAVRELETGAADMVVLGGADTVQNPFTYLAFSKTHAFSPRGRCRPFDASADGIVISEGVAVLVLKRLADARRDGDRVYAVIKGVGASSDGRAKGLTAPRPEGQIRALERAYAKAGIDPATVGYVEAHGTGTAAGDAAEIETLTQVFSEAGAAPGSCVVGSVKSQIGHTKCAAGLAGLINASLALYHGVIPPTIGVTRPSPRADWPSSPFRLNTAARPWLHAETARPRRAGVSAFGFGGTNFHAVLEAHDLDPNPPLAPSREWPAELLVLRAVDAEGLRRETERAVKSLAGPDRLPLRDWVAAENARTAAIGATLAIVANSVDDLRAKLEEAGRSLAAGKGEIYDPRGIYAAVRPAFAGTPLAFLFPGQGAQTPEMLADLAVAFPEVRGGFEAFDSALRRLGRPPVGPLVFGSPVFADADRDRRKADLLPPDVAQPAIGAASLGLLALLKTLGVTPDVVAGHSYGELVALHAAGAYSAEALAELSEARGRLMQAAAGDSLGGMAAVAVGPERIVEVLEGIAGVEAVNWNGPAQTVISGPAEAVDRAIERAKGLNLRAQRLPVAAAFHSSQVAGAAAPLATLAASLGPATPDKTVYSNVTAAPYSNDAGAIPALLGSHVARPVRFAEMVGAMHAAGARVFLEVGPGATLTPLVDSILNDAPHVSVALDRPGRPGIPTLLHALARLAVAGVPLRLERLAEGRLTAEAPEAIPASAWLVNGSRARPLHAPEPLRFGAAGTMPEVSAVRPPLPGRNGSNTSVANGTVRNGSHPAAAPAVADARRLGDVPVGGESALRSRPLDSSTADPGAGRVVEAFQETMRAFLDVQRSTMLGYLAGRTGSARPLTPPPISSGANGRGSSAGPVGIRPEEPSKVPSQGISPRTSGGSPGSDVTGPATVARVHSSEGPRENSHSHPSGNGHGKTAVLVAAAVAEPEGLDREAMAGRLLQIVRDRTGYPAEMLRLDLDLEGDLGIDSIKRVEILGSLRDALPSLGLGSDGATMDALARAKTLGGIVERLARPRGGSAGREARSSTSTAVAEAPRGEVEVVVADPDAGVRRLLLERVEAPLPGRAARLAPGGVVLITDDGRGIARDVAADLRSLGHPVVRVRHGVSSGEIEGVNLASETAVEALLERVRQKGPIAGLVHALPLREMGPSGLDSGAWTSRLAPEVRGLFLLAKGVADDLGRSSRAGGACFIAATAMGGAFASAGEVPNEFFAGQGGVAGLVKTLAREWAGVRARVVDFDPSADVEVVAADLVQEVRADDPAIEVGYRRGRRLALRAVASSLDVSGSPSLVLAPGDPVVMTGGARGITAAVAAELARRWRPTLLLVGSSPLPPEVEDPSTAALESVPELKAALHAQFRRAGREVGPAEVERAYQSLRRAREIRANLRKLRGLGSRVEYAQADVRDAEGLGRVLNGWRGEFGPVAGVVHGAGVIQDKLLRDKTAESFDQVVGIKVEGALTLSRLVRPESLKFAAFFSSVAGRFGNRGQADYAAANEALSKLATWLDRRWPSRVVATIWGPWSGVGMVSDLEGHLGRRGLGLIPPAVGARMFVDELAFGRKGDVEVVLSGEMGALERGE